MIVVDANVMVYFWLPGEHTSLAETCLKKDPDWVSSTLWRSEFRNVLAGYLRRSELTLQQCMSCMEGAEAQLAGHEFRVPSDAVMKRVQKTTCSAYDCEYVALAEDLGVKLVTADRKILRECPEHTMGLREFARSSR